MTTRGTRPRGAGRGFSLVEMLMALAISSALLAATLVALDASFKSYKMTTESASTHVVSRIVMHRILTLIRTGQDFAPYPADVLDRDANPVTDTAIEFLAEADVRLGSDVITRIERRPTEPDAPGPYELWYLRIDPQGGEEGSPLVLEEYPLLRDLQEVLFTLEYDIGPRLVRATVDLTIEPNDYEEISTGGTLEPPTIRLVASAAPRQPEQE